MNSFYSAKWENIFYYILTIKLLIKYWKIFLTMVHIAIHNSGNNSDIHRSLKYCIKNFKTSLKNMKIWDQHILYLEENKVKGRKKGPQYWIILFYSKDILTFNELVIKNTLVKKLDHFRFYGRVSPAS